MKTVVVLGMHSSGTSMFAGILHALGVDMNPNPSGKVRHYKTNEDADFFRLNIQILMASGGNWRKPPDERQILGNEARFRERIIRLIESRNNQSDLWGFKDPRTCLTARLYHEHLRNPIYVRVLRSHEDVAASMVRRHGREEKSRWIRLSEEYCRRADAFLDEIDAHVLRMESERLFGKGAPARNGIRGMAEFVGLEVTGAQVERALSVILERKI